METNFESQSVEIIFLAQSNRPNRVYIVLLSI